MKKPPTVITQPLDHIPNDEQAYHPLFNVGDLRLRRIKTDQRGAWMIDCAWDKSGDLWMLHLVASPNDGGVTGLTQLTSALFNKSDGVSANLIEWREHTQYGAGRYVRDHRGYSVWRPGEVLGTMWTAHHDWMKVRLAPDQLKRKYPVAGKKASGFYRTHKPLVLRDLTCYEGWVLPRSVFVSSTEPDFFLMVPKVWTRAQRMQDFSYHLMRRVPNQFLVPEYAGPLWDWMTTDTMPQIRQISAFGQFDCYLCSLNVTRITPWISAQTRLGNLPVRGYEDVNPRIQMAA